MHAGHGCAASRDGARRPSSGGRPLAVTAAGGAGLDFDNTAGTIAAAQLAADCITSDKLDDTVGSEIRTGLATTSDLLDKLEYYLANPEGRVAIAQAGQERTLNHHLYRHRLQTVLQAIQPGPPPVEYATTKLWDDVKSLLPEADIVLDCGANIGQMARSFRNTYPGAEIYSFEPVRSVFEQLRKTCDEVNAHAVRKAVSDRDGTATIHLTASAEANSLLDFQEGKPCGKVTRGGGWCPDS